MSTVPRPKMSPEEYLATERASETKHEYVNGEVYAMAGGSREHNLIVGNLVGEIGTRLKGGRCEVYPSGMRLQVSETGLYTYPDAMVVCEPPRFADREVDTLLNPKVIFEVLSGSTRTYDRGAMRRTQPWWKWAHFRRLGSLAEYVMVAQDEYQVEQLVRQPDGTWLFREHTTPEETLRFQSLGVEIPLSEIYYQVAFGSEG